MHSKDSSIVPQSHSINYLPQEILSYLFRFLKKNELVKLMRVCKHWYVILEEIVSPMREFQLNPFSSSNVETATLEFELEHHHFPQSTEIFTASNEHTQICFLSNQKITEKWIHAEGESKPSEFLLLTACTNNEENYALYVFNVKTKERLMLISFLSTGDPLHLYFLRKNCFIPFAPHHYMFNNFNFHPKKFIICDLSNQNIICKKISSLTDVEENQFQALSSLQEREKHVEFKIIENQLLNKYNRNIDQQVLGLIEFNNLNNKDSTLSQKSKENYEIFFLFDGQTLSFNFPFQEKLTQPITVLKLDLQHELAYYQYSADNEQLLFFYKNNFAGTSEQVFQTTYPLTPKDNFFESHTYHRLMIASLLGLSEKEKYEIDEQISAIHKKYNLPDSAPCFSEADFWAKQHLNAQKTQRKFVIQIWDTVTCKLLTFFMQAVKNSFQIEKILKKNTRLIILTSQNEELEYVFHLIHFDLKNPEKNNFHSPNTIIKVKQSSLSGNLKSTITRDLLSIHFSLTEDTTSPNPQYEEVFKIFNLVNGKEIFTRTASRTKVEDYHLEIAENNKTVVLAKTQFHQKNPRVSCTVQSFKQHLWLSHKTVLNTTHSSENENSKENSTRPQAPN